MLTVLIEVGPDEAGALGATLATLVPGAVEGLVRDVVVLDRGLDAAGRTVADHAGCRIVPVGARRAALSSAKGDWLLFVEPGARLGAGWVDAALEHLAGLEPGPARFSAVPSKPALDLWRRLTRRRRGLEAALILPKARALASIEGRRDLEALARHVAAVRLAATIRPRP